VRPLPGYPVLGDASKPVLAGGAVVDLVLSHNHASRDTIVITSLKPQWTHQPLPPKPEPHYQIDAAALPPQGFFSPERFTLALGGRKIRSAFWPGAKGQGPAKVVDDDLLHTEPPRQIRLNDQTDDTVSLEGVVRLTAPGRYTLRWDIGYTVAGKPEIVTTDPLEFVSRE
jgi:hypothetical protein